MIEKDSASRLKSYEYVMTESLVPLAEEALKN